jgi:hypothetical protein
MNTTPPEDPELERLIECHLESDLAATQALDARLATDPQAALAFAKAHRMDTLLASFHQSTRTKSPLIRFVRPLAWIAAAATIGFLGWIAIHPASDHRTTVETPTTAPPVRRILSPLRMEAPESPLVRNSSLSAAEIETKASNFYLPAIDMNTTSLDDVLADIQGEFRRIAARHGDQSAEGIRIEARGFDTPPAGRTSPTIRLSTGGSLKTMLAVVALQAGGLLTFTDGAATIEGVQSRLDPPVSAVRSFPLGDEILLPLLTGVSLPDKHSDKGDDPFRIAVSQRVVSEIRFENATLDEAVEFVRVKSRELDPLHEEFNVVLKKPRDHASPSNGMPITMHLQNVPIGEILRLIAKEAGLQAVEQEHAFVIASADDPIFAVKPIEFALAGLRASYNQRERTLALDGNEDLVDAAGRNLEELERAPTQVLIASKFICVDPSAFHSAKGSAPGIDLLKGDQIGKATQFRTLEAQLAQSKAAEILTSPSVVTREFQRAKIEIIREICFREGGDDGTLTPAMAPLGWSMEVHPTFIGEAIHLTGKLVFSSLEETPSSEELQIGGTLHPQGDPREIDPDTLPIGNPLHFWELEFEAELLSGQKALLEFMNLADGKTIYAILGAERIDPAGRRIFPENDE